MPRDRHLAAVDMALNGERTPLIEPLVSSAIARGAGEPARILEIGFGEGNVLLELAAEFRGQAAEFYGIDARLGPGHQITVHQRDDLRTVLRRHEIVPDSEVAAFPLPDVEFYAVGEGDVDELEAGEASGLHYADEMFDVVFSVATIRFVADKAKVLEEVARVLRPGGIALLDIDDRGWDYAAAASDGTFSADEYGGRLLLMAGDTPIPITSYLPARAAPDFQVRFRPSRRCVVEITKHTTGARLGLGLIYDRRLSLTRAQMPRDERGRPSGGCRSGYVVDESALRGLDVAWVGALERTRGTLPHTDIAP